MAITVADRSGLNPTEVLDMPLITQDKDARELYELAVQKNKSSP